MKKLLKTYFFLVSSVLLLGACSGYDNRNACLLSHIDSLLDVRPDSALRMLQSVSPDSLADRNERAYYGLLLVQAKYKNYLPLKDDTLSQALATYYGETGNRAMQARAYYNLGCVYTDREEFDHAFRAYHEAARLARQENDKLTLCRTYNNMAHICLTQGMPERADSLYAAVETLARQTGDSIRLAEALLRRGIYQLSLGQEAYPQAKQLIWQGYELAQKEQSTAILHLAFSSLYMLHRFLDQNREALEVARRFVAMPSDDTARSRAWLFLGDAYYQQNQYDSAAVCLKRALDTDDYQVKKNTCALLARIAEKEGDWKKAVHWNDELKRHQLKQQDLRHTVELAVAAREVELNESMRLQTEESFPISYVIISLLFLCLGVMVWMLFRKRNSHTNPIPQEKVHEEQPAWNFTAFQQGIRKTASFAKAIKILEYHKQYEEYSQHWTTADTLNFFQEVNTLLPGYRTALQTKYPALSIQDTFLCMLYLAGLKDGQIGILIERDKSSVIRKRQGILRQKMGQGQTKTDNLLEICMLTHKTAINAPTSETRKI